MFLDRKVLSVLLQLHDGSKKNANELVANSYGILMKSTICVLISRMEDANLIQVQDENIVAAEKIPPRDSFRQQVYSITSHGRKRLAELPSARLIL